jgi:hypothetical protein
MEVQEELLIWFIKIGRKYRSWKKIRLQQHQKLSNF